MNADLSLMHQLNVRNSREEIHMNGGDKFNDGFLNFNLDSKIFEMDKNIMDYGQSPRLLNI